MSIGQVKNKINIWATGSKLTPSQAILVWLTVFQQSAVKGLKAATNSSPSSDEGWRKHLLRWSESSGKITCTASVMKAHCALVCVHAPSPRLLFPVPWGHVTNSDVLCMTMNNILWSVSQAFCLWLLKSDFVLDYDALESNCNYYCMCDYMHVRQNCWTCPLQRGQLHHCWTWAKWMLGNTEQNKHKQTKK